MLLGLKDVPVDQAEHEYMMSYAAGEDWSLTCIPPSTQAFAWGRFGLGPLHRLVRLTSLKFEEDSLDPNNIAALARSLELFSDLKRLELPSLMPEPTMDEDEVGPDVSTLSSSLAGLVSLEHLVMGSVGLSSEDANSMLPSLIALQHLDLSSNQLTSDIAPALAALKALTYLDLGGNDMWGDDEGLASISASVALLTKLVYLELDSYNDNDLLIDAAAAAALGHSLPRSLTYLSMAGNYFGAGGLLALAPGLQRLTALRRLNLSCNVGGGEDGWEDHAGSMQALADCLKRLTGLTSLDLSGNHFGPDYFSMLAGSLNLQNLLELHLGFNQLGVGGAYSLATCLPRMLKLRGLYLSFSNLGNDGFAALAASLVDLPSLTKIDFSNNQLTGIAVEALSSALRGTGRPQAMPALESLDMGSNELDDRSAGALAGCLEHMPNLKSLLLFNFHFRCHDFNGVATVVAAVQKLDSLTLLDFSTNNVFHQEGKTLRHASVCMLKTALERPGMDLSVRV